MPPTTHAAHRPFPALASREFALLFWNSMFSAGANWALLLARGWLVFDLTRSSTAVGLVTFAGMAPFVFATPIAGVLADRMDRRLLSVWAAVIAMAGTLGLAAVTIAGVVEPWQIVVFSLLGGVARAVQTPAQQAMIPGLVPDDQLLSAMALSSVSQNGSRILGPLLGGVLIEVVGVGAVFLLAAGLFAVGIACLLAMRASRVAAVPRSSFLRDLRAGMAYVGEDRRVTLLIVMVIFHCGLTMAFDALLPQLASDLGGGSRTFSALLLSVGAGAIVGTVGLARADRASTQGNALGLAGAGSGLALVLMGGTASVPAAVAGAALAGCTQAAFMTIAATFVQGLTPDAFRGRVMSLYVMLAAGHMAFINLGFGALADLVGARVVLVVPGLIWTAVFVAGWAAFADLRRLFRTGTFATA